MFTRPRVDFSFRNSNFWNETRDFSYSRLHAGCVDVHVFSPLRDLGLSTPYDVAVTLIVIKTMLAAKAGGALPLQINPSVQLNVCVH